MATLDIIIMLVVGAVYWFLHSTDFSWMGEDVENSYCGEQLSAGTIDSLRAELARDRS